jgi:hypothetical protein
MALCSLNVNAILMQCIHNEMCVYTREALHSTRQCENIINIYVDIIILITTTNELSNYIHQENN